MTPARAASGSARFTLRFVLLAAVSQVAYTTIIAPSSFFAWHQATNASIAASIMRALGLDAQATGNALFAGGTSLTIERGCDAIQATCFLVAAILAYPSTWFGKLVACLLGSGILWSLNIARVVTLYFVARRSKEMFDTVHLALWPGVMIVSVLAIWLTWVHRVERSGDASGKRAAAVPT